MRRRLAFLVLAMTALAVLMVPALATEEAPTSTAPADTATEETVAGLEPAVTVPAPAENTGPDDWTYRFLIPTLIVLAIVVVIATTIQYFLRVVRNRYKVVE